jgi:hypothetical protein
MPMPNQEPPSQHALSKVIVRIESTTGIVHNQNNLTITYKAVIGYHTMLRHSAQAIVLATVYQMEF